MGSELCAYVYPASYPDDSWRISGCVSNRDCDDTRQHTLVCVCFSQKKRLDVLTAQAPEVVDVVGHDADEGLYTVRFVESKPLGPPPSKSLAEADS